MPRPALAEPWQGAGLRPRRRPAEPRVFSADEWAQALGGEIREALANGGCRDGLDYYERWCEALSIS